MSRPTILLRRLLPLGLVLLAAFAPAQEQEAGFSFGVVPQRTAIDLARSWVPILDYLGAKTGYRFEFRTARDADAFEQRLDTGEFDLVYMNPYQYILSHAKHGYRVYAKEKDRLLTGLIVVRANSPYREVRELEGKTLAFAAGDTVRFEDGELHGFENTGDTEFEYISVTAPPANFRAAYAADWSKTKTP